MHFRVIGLSFQHTPLKQRQLFAFPASRHLEALLSFSQHFPSSGCVLLSTCNRIEIYTSTAEFSAILHWWAKFLGQNPEQLETSTYQKTGKNALAHLIEVCAGIDSMVIGENQILGQVKQAYQLAFDCQMVDKTIIFFFERAFKCTKKLKTLTGLSTYQVSVASLAANAALKNTPSDKSHFLVIGAGQTSELLLKYLHQQKKVEVTIINRTEKKAQALAIKYGVNYASFDQMKALIAKSSTIFTAISRTSPLLESACFPLEQHSKKNWHIFDLSLPVSTSVSLEHNKRVRITYLDDLKEQALINNKKREKDRSKALLFIKHFLLSVEKELLLLTKQESITGYLEHCNFLRDSSVKAILKELESGSCPKDLIEKLSYQLMNKLTHLHVRSLKSALSEEKMIS